MSVNIEVSMLKKMNLETVQNDVCSISLIIVECLKSENNSDTLKLEKWDTVLMKFQMLTKTKSVKKFLQIHRKVFYSWISWHQKAWFHSTISQLMLSHTLYLHDEWVDVKKDEDSIWLTYLNHANIYKTVILNKMQSFLKIFNNDCV